MKEMAKDGEILCSDMKPKNLEWSLQAPSVQEMMKEPLLDKVPPRYVIDDDILGDSCDHDVPRIDMAKLMKENNESSHISELLKLYDACKDWGVFQLLNHGMPIRMLENMKECAKEFFELPLQEKMPYAHRPGSIEGYGHVFIKSDDQRLDWNDMFFLKTHPADSRSYHLWPDKPARFQDALEKYSEEMCELVRSLVKYMMKALMMMTGDGPNKPATDRNEDDHNKLFLDSMKRAKCEVKMNYYPPCPQPKRVMGISPHVDISVVTLLVQCGDVSGFQLLKDGYWVTVPPVEGSIIVNLGAIMQIFSNGIYRAPDHRAVVNKYKERMSIATFFYPDASFDIGPSKRLTGGSKGVLPLYKTVNHSEFFDHFFNLNQVNDPFFDGLRI